MKLTDLEPRWIKYYTEPEGHGFRETLTIELADGFWFLCPVCFAKHGGARGTHRVCCNKPHVPKIPGRYVGPGRWHMVGTGFHDLTLNGAPEVNGNENRSVQLEGGCAAHFHITNGEIQPC